MSDEIKNIFPDFSLENALKVREHFRKINHKFYNYIDTFGLNETEIRDLNYLINPKTPNWVEIKEAPIGITEDGSIVCIPKLKERPNINNFGVRGFGKTTLSKRQMDMSYWMFKHNLCLMNDYLVETPIWTTPMENPYFINKLRLLFEEPIPLPIVPLIPKSIVKNKYNIKDNIPRFETSIDFKDFIENIDLFIPDLGASESYVKNLDYSNCYENGATYQSFIDALNGLPDTKGMSQVRAKFLNRVKMYFNDGIISLSEDRLTKINDGEEEENPFIIIMKHGGIPSLITEKIITKKYYPDLFCFLIDYIWDYHSSNPSFRQKGLYFFIEEWSKIKAVESKRGKNATNKINEIAQGGRTGNIGMILNTQNYSDVDEPVSSNADYSFMFRSSSAEDTKKFCKDFGIDKKEYYNKINKLEPHNFIGVTTKHFVVYNPITNERYNESSPIECMTIPPLSNQIPPEERTRWNDNVDFGSSFHSRTFFNMLQKDKRKFFNPVTNKSLYEINNVIDLNKFIPNPKNPILIEHLDLSSVYFPDKRHKKMVGLSFLKNKGIYLCQNKINGKCFLNPKYEITANSVPLEEMPKDVVVTANFLTRKLRLVGRNVDGGYIPF